MFSTVSSKESPVEKDFFVHYGYIKSLGPAEPNDVVKISSVSLLAVFFDQLTLQFYTPRDGKGLSIAFFI